MEVTLNNLTKTTINNINGVVFGFVCYSKVKDIDKLLKVVNNIWFGDCKVVAKVSTFDRYGNKRGGGKVRGKGEKRKAEGEKIHEGEKRKVGVDGGRGNVKMQGETVYGGKPVFE